MGRLVLSLGLFLVVLLLVGLGIEAIVYWQMDNRRAHVHEDWPDMHGLNAELVFLGNSRTAGHVIPEVVCQGLAESCYNLAYDGYTSQMGAYRLEYLLDHAANHPKTVVVQLDLSFCQGNGRQDNYPMKDGVLRYFFLDQIGINQYYRHYDNWREMDAFIPLLRYKGYPLIFFKHLLGWNRWDRREKKGFWHTNKEIGFQMEEAPSDNNVSLSLCGIDSICQHNHIQLIGMIPPSPQSSYRPSNQKLDSLSRFLKVLDFSNLFENHESDYFYDEAHFSLDGAKLFSRVLHDSLSYLVQPVEENESELVN